jgi:dihydroorotase
MLLMLHYYKQGIISLEKIVEKMSHAVAECFQIKDRGYIREGYFADLVLVDLNKQFEVKKENILYKCGWSPFEAMPGETYGFIFPANIETTFINGIPVYENGQWNESYKGQRLEFDR